MTKILIYDLKNSNNFAFLFMLPGNQVLSSTLMLFLKDENYAENICTKNTFGTITVLPSVILSRPFMAATRK